MVVLATALTYVAQEGGSRLVDAATRQLADNRWRRRLAAKAFDDLARPRLKRDLGKWLDLPETAQLLFSPTAPEAADRQPLDEYLASHSRRWAALPVEERHRRTDVILSRVYDQVIQQCDHAGWAVAIASERQMAIAHQTLESVERVAATQTEQASQFAEVQTAEFREMLRVLPPSITERLTAWWATDRGGVWRVVTSATDLDTTPTRLMSDWSDATPAWVLDSHYPVLIAAADVASSYGAPILAARLWEAAAAAGAPRRGYWLARSVLAREEAGDGEGVRRLGGQLQATAADEPLSAIAHALTNADLVEAGRLVADWAPVDPSDRVLRATLRHKVLMLSLAGGRMTQEAIDDSIRMFDEVADCGEFAGLTLGKARLLTIRAQLGAGMQRERDLHEAQRLALAARDQRRRWRGDSAEAVAVACQAAFLAHDPRAVLSIGTVRDDGATAEEAAAEDVRRVTALAAASEGQREEAEALADGLTDPFLRASVSALLALAQGNDPSAHWYRALEAATDDGQRLQSLLGLAAAGITDLPGLDELRQQDPDSVLEIEAVGELARNNPGDAIAKLRGLRATSYTAALNLAQAYSRTGDIDAEVQTLKDAAKDFGDVHLRMSAASALLRANRSDEAERELEEVLTSAPSEWPGRPAAARFLADIALTAGRLELATERLRAALDGDPSDDSVRWVLARVLQRRGDFNGSWQIYKDRRPEPTTVDEAHAWIEMFTRFVPGEETVRGCLTLVRRFGPSERLSAHAFMAILMRGNQDPLPEPLLADLHAEMEQFFGRWPDSLLLRQFSTGDIAALVEQMTDMVRPSDEQARQRRELGRQLIYGALPVGVLAATARRSYAEVVIKRGIGFLPARHADPAEHDSMVSSTLTAFDGDIAIDTTAAVVLDLLPDSVRRAAIGAFRRVITSDEVLRDAHVANDALTPRSASVWAWDARIGDARLRDFPQEDADQFADDAQRLVGTVESFHRLPRSQVRIIEGLDDDVFLPWSALLDLAAEQAIPTWVDDVGLRNIARQAGLTVTSTPALLRVLLSTGRITQAEHDESVRALLEARVGDWPLNADHLIEIAEDELWCANTVAAVLGRPAAWSDVLAAVRLVDRVLPVVAAKKADELPNWISFIVTGAALAFADQPDVAVNIAALVLVKGIVLHPPGPDRVMRLVTAIRVALDEAGPQPGWFTDPVPRAARILRDALSGLLPQQHIVPYILGLFSGLQDTERVAVLMAVIIAPTPPSG